MMKKEEDYFDIYFGHRLIFNKYFRSYKSL